MLFALGHAGSVFVINVLAKVYAILTFISILTCFSFRFYFITLIVLVENDVAANICYRNTILTGRYL